MDPVRIAVNQIEKPHFFPKYIINKFANELNNDALLLLSNKISQFDFEIKINQLIKTDSNSYDGFFNNYIGNHYYKFDTNKSIFVSGLSSVFECLLKFSNFGFATFFAKLSNELEFNNVIYYMIIKYAPKSMRVHDKLSKEYPGYTFHHLSLEQMEIIVSEVYQIYLIVQNFINNLSVDEKNYIEIIENLDNIANEEYLRNKKYIGSRQIFEKSNQEYIFKYNRPPPKINYNRLY
jgi:hypothetical protein